MGSKASKQKETRKQMIDVSFDRWWRSLESSKRDLDWCCFLGLAGSGKTAFLNHAILLHEDKEKKVVRLADCSLCQYDRDKAVDRARLILQSHRSSDWQDAATSDQSAALAEVLSALSEASGEQRRQLLSGARRVDLQIGSHYERQLLQLEADRDAMTRPHTAADTVRHGQFTVGVNTRDVTVAFPPGALPAAGDGDRKLPSALPKRLKLQCVDVSGGPVLRSEVWAQALDGALSSQRPSALFFVFGLDLYDAPWFEEPGKRQLHWDVAAKSFESLPFQDLSKNSTVVVVFNRIDAFRRKLQARQGSFSAQFPKFRGDAQNAAECIAHLAQDLLARVADKWHQPLLFLVTNAMDPRSVRGAFDTALSWVVSGRGSPIPARVQQLQSELSRTDQGRRMIESYLGKRAFDADSAAAAAAAVVRDASGHELPAGQRAVFYPRLFQWSPDTHAHFSPAFQAAVRCVLLLRGLRPSAAAAKGTASSTSGAASPDRKPLFPECGLWKLPWPLMQRILFMASDSRPLDPSDVFSAPVAEAC